LLCQSPLSRLQSCVTQRGVVRAREPGGVSFRVLVRRCSGLSPAGAMAPAVATRAYVASGSARRRFFDRYHTYACQDRGSIHSRLIRGAYIVFDVFRDVRRSTASGQTSMGVIGGCLRSTISRTLFTISLLLVCYWILHLFQIVPNCRLFGKSRYTVFLYI
jgi:hypothetical protein